MLVLLSPDFFRALDQTNNNLEICVHQATHKCSPLVKQNLNSAAMAQVSFIGNILKYCVAGESARHIVACHALDG